MLRRYMVVDGFARCIIPLDCSRKPSLDWRLRTPQRLNLVKFPSVTVYPKSNLPKRLVVRPDIQSGCACLDSAGLIAIPQHPDAQSLMNALKKGLHGSFMNETHLTLSKSQENYCLLLIKPVIQDFKWCMTSRLKGPNPLAGVAMPIPIRSFTITRRKGCFQTRPCIDVLRDIEAQSSLVRNIIKKHTSSSPTSIIEALGRLKNGAEVMAHSAALLKGRAQKVEEANEAASQRKSRKRKPIQKGETL